MKVTSIGKWLMAVFVVILVSLAEVSVVGEEVDVVSTVVVSLPSVVISFCPLIAPRATRIVRSIMIFIVYYC